MSDAIDERDERAGAGVDPHDGVVYHCRGFIVRAQGDEFEVSHAVGSEIGTALDRNGLDFLLRFCTPCTLADARAHFVARGWDLADEVYAEVLAELVAGKLVAPWRPTPGEAGDAGEGGEAGDAGEAGDDGEAGDAGEAATMTSAPAGEVRPDDDGTITIGDAEAGDAAAVARLDWSLRADMEEKRLAGAGEPMGVDDATLGAALALAPEARMLLSLLCWRALAPDRGGLARAAVAADYARRLSGLTPFAEALAALAPFVDDGATLALRVPRAAWFPLYAALGRARAEAIDDQALRAAECEAVHLVARRGGDVLGYVEGRLVRLDGIWAEAELLTMVVAPDARGSGLGGRLVRALQARCRARLIPTLKVVTQRTNPDAIRFYERLGFGRIDDDLILMWSPPAHG